MLSDRRGWLAGGVIGVLLAGCSAPPEAEFPISDAAAARPLPGLVATEQFTQALEASAPTVTRLSEQRDDLAASAEELRQSAAGLAPPVLDPADRARLTEAAQPN